MVTIYTAGYMAGKGSGRPDWRKALVAHMDHRTDSAIQWLHPGVPQGQIPGQGDPGLYMVRDLAQIRAADVMVALFDLGQARCMGAASEVGIGYEQRMPIVMIDLSPEIGSLDFARNLATSVCKDIKGAADVVRFLAQGFCGA